MIKSLLNISDLTLNDLNKILSQKNQETYLNNKTIGLIFEKYSTRTRLSFNVGINQLHGNALDIKFEELNISREESFEDTFKAMNCYLDGLIYRTTNHKRLEEASKFFQKPIINALSDLSHPCQILSDLFTIKEHFDSLNINILWMGDMNNVCFSLVEAANIISDIKLTICSPYEISKKINWKINKNIHIVDKIENINLSEIQCVMTDVFISMNDENNKEKIELLTPYSVNENLMTKTNENSVFMHCLPARVGMEVTDEVFRSSKSIVWKQASNRMITQKKLLQNIKW